MRWRREEGFELGPLALNTVLTFAALTVAMTIGFVVTYPDVPVWPIVGWSLAVAVLLPILLYPFTFTLWFGFEVVTHPPEAAELAEAHAALAAGDVAGWMTQLDDGRAARKSG